MNAGDRQWGLKIQDDLLDAVAWAVRTGIGARERVCIMGGSYGGYATLAALSTAPAVFACGVDVVGALQSGDVARCDAAVLGADARAVPPARGRPDHLFPDEKHGFARPENDLPSWP